MDGITKNDLIQKYLFLAESIERAERRLHSVQRTFHAQSMHTRTETTKEGEIITVGFRQDTEVVRYLDCLADIEQNIDKNRKRKRYFDQFLHTLPPEAQIYIHRRYKRSCEETPREKLEQVILDEINEIEEAISYQYGYEAEPRETLEGDTTKMAFTDVLKLLEV